MLTLYLDLNPQQAAAAMQVNRRQASGDAWTKCRDHPWIPSTGAVAEL